ncbi:MAG: aspartate/glutamate racemase family protein [Rhodobacteraceae bacterium]|nr:aspartate/glutamate racemase family protein [Paracoccaceae bacterium]
MTADRHRIGLIVPSSNTVVEDVWTRIAPSMQGLACHFARISVTAIQQDAATAAQFEREKLLAAADLLAELRPERIVWAGTAAAWIGFDHDLELCAQITARTGVPATTSLLEVNAALAARGAARIALITPYRAETEAAIIANYEASGVSVVAQRRLDLTVNTDFAAVTPEALARMAEEASASEADAILIVCTNLRGAEAMAHLSAGTREKVIDSVAATYQSLQR